LQIAGVDLPLAWLDCLSDGVQVAAGPAEDARACLHLAISIVLAEVAAKTFGGVALSEADSSEEELTAADGERGAQRYEQDVQKVAEMLAREELPHEADYMALLSEVPLHQPA
jgi:hypothetical protein